MTTLDLLQEIMALIHIGSHMSDLTFVLEQLRDVLRKAQLHHSGYNIIYWHYKRLEGGGPPQAPNKSPLFPQTNMEFTEA